MEVMKSSEVKYGRVTIEVVHNPDIALSVDNLDTHAFLTFKSAESFLEWKPNTARKKLASKGLKSSLGEEPQLGKRLVEDSRGKPTEMGLIPFELFERIVLWQADEGNPKAKAIVAAGFRDSIRSAVIEQVTGKPVPIADRLRKIDEDRNAFYAQYAAGISDKDWLEGNGVGSITGLDLSRTEHWAAFDHGFVPGFLTMAISRGQDPDEILEEMRIKYE